MASNPYVNKVQFGNQTIMDISDTDAQESDVVAGKTFYKGTGQRSVGTADYYSPSDTAETTIADADYFPFYDSSATAKRKTLWSNIKSVLNEVFFKRSEQAVLGAKNFLKYPYYGGSSLVHSNGITYTVDSNGVIDLNGTASGDCNYNIAHPSDTYLKAGRYVLSKGNTQSGVTVWINVFNNDTFVRQIVSVSNSATESSPFDLDFSDYNKIQIGCQVSSGTTVSHVKTYPMLRLASDPDSTYVPYAMTNKELTDGLSGKQDALTLPLSTANGGTGNATGYIRTGQKSGSNASTGTTIEGHNNTATAQYAHSEGSSNSATAASAHVEGTNNYATGNSSHAEGSYNRADGAQSHAQGSRCEADGDYSHTGGYYLYAGYQSQTVVGEYNDNKASTVFEVGNGTSTNARSNALEVYLDGHINVNGDIQKNGLDALETVVATSFADNGTVTFSGVDDTVGGTHMYSVGFDVTSSSTQKAPYAELQSISGEGTSSMTLVYNTNADNGSSSNKNAFLIRKIL